MYQPIEIAIQDAIRIAESQLAAQILHQLVGCEHVVADLAAEIDVQLGILGLARLRPLLLQLEFVEACAKLLERAVTVFMLRTFVLALYYDAGWEVRDSHGRIGHVDVLPARARRAERVDAQILVLNIDLDFVVDLRIDEHAGKAGVPPRVGVERRDANQAMHADLALQEAVGVFAIDLERRALDAG